jgi:hypothetical protein
MNRAVGFAAEVALGWRLRGCRAQSTLPQSPLKTIDFGYKKILLLSSTSVLFMRRVHLCIQRKLIYAMRDSSLVINSIPHTKHHKC